MTRAERPFMPTVLIIRDGWGQNPHQEHDAFNAVKLARTPVAERLMREWPWTLVRTCGEDVGLPVGTMGNSEVGHQNIGAGRIVDQELMRITRAIREGRFAVNPAMLGAFEHARRERSNLHVMGLLSDGKVHSDLEHLFAILDAARAAGFPGERVFVHAFMDGRDVGPTTGLGYIQSLEEKLKGMDGRSLGRIATVTGRYYAMDRDNRWERVALAYQALTGIAVSHLNMKKLLPGWSKDQIPTRCARSASDAVNTYYREPDGSSQVGDEFIPPTRIVDHQSLEPVGLIRDNDAVVFFNFRGDRPRELTKAFMLDDHAWKRVPGEKGGFDRNVPLKNLYYCTMSRYEEGLPVTAVMFDKPAKMANILGQVVSAAGKSQFRCAETEKFPHVTFFFNDYREEPFEGEHRELIPSPKDVATYDLKPQMSAEGVCEAVLRRIGAESCEDLIVVNFANPDMVGHTGKLDAAIKAVEVVDRCVGRIVDAMNARRSALSRSEANSEGGVIVMADHGNAEQMWDPDHNCPHTAHTTYDVPFILVDPRFTGRKLPAPGKCRLADVAPTVLKMMGLTQPAEMTGRAMI